MARDLHGNLFGHPGAGQVSRRTASQVMNKKPVKSGFSARGFPDLTEIADLISVIVKNIRTVEPVHFGSHLNNLPQAA